MVYGIPLTNEDYSPLRLKEMALGTDINYAALEAVMIRDNRLSLERLFFYLHPLGNQNILTDPFFMLLQA